MSDRNHGAVLPRAAVVPHPIRLALSMGALALLVALVPSCKTDIATGDNFTLPTREEALPHKKISATQGGFTGGLPNRMTFALALASLGDLDGDGVGDLASFGRHGIWILFLNVDGTVKAHQRISGTPEAHQRISAAEGGFTGRRSDIGPTVTSLGDLDGDGITEIATGNNRPNNRDIDRGAALILFLNADGTVKSQQRISSTHGGFTGPLSDGDSFAIEVASLGDLDGDGVPDMAAGARFDDDGGKNRGAVWVLFLNSDGTVKSHQKISATQGGFTGALDDSDLFGESIASVGDLDGDGVGDIAVSAVWDDDGGRDRGAVWILFLRSDGTVKSHQKISSSQGGFTGTLGNRDYFGGSLSTLGDLDGDGVVELAVGAASDDDGGADRGAVWILYLDTAGSVKSHQKISSTQGGFTGTLSNDDYFGTSVDSLGNLSGTGVGDLAVLAWRDDDGGPGHGAIWILFLDRAFCSDGVLNDGEQCDDGNIADGDGCSRICQIEVEDAVPGDPARIGHSSCVSAGRPSMGIMSSIPTGPRSGVGGVR
jgi:cysteine-rich repeat protein